MPKLSLRSLEEVQEALRQYEQTVEGSPLRLSSKPPHSENGVLTGAMLLVMYQLLSGFCRVGGPAARRRAAIQIRFGKLHGDDIPYYPVVVGLERVGRSGRQVRGRGTE